MYVLSNKVEKFKNAQHSLIQKMSIKIPNKINTDIQIDGEYYNIKTNKIDVSIIKTIRNNNAVTYFKNKLMRKIVFIFIFLANAIYGQQTKIDTLKKITVNNNQVFKLKKLIIPTVLIGYGVIGIESDGLKFINSGIKEEVNENIDQKITIDDFSQYASSNYSLRFKRGRNKR